MLTLAAAVMAVPVDAKQRPRLSSEQRIATCIREAAGGRQWLEQTLWGFRDQEGGWIGAEILNRDGSHDLGPLQVNSWWVSKLAMLVERPQASVRWWLTHDPCFNVQAARWIFLSRLRVARDYWTAVGAYHSPTGWRQRRYAIATAAKIKRRFGASAFSQTLHGHPIRSR
ncbi:MAG: lytic transglycosylase domain-containing protein [Sphingomonas sp.]|uniref:lytic transglycosylase domain-containing protein n=1 Tax=Sphingomonas sp. TaxID=28214 RepID=UPI002618F6FC|nr:lytic transglycosylase domain-containing protein [Sphingomonas sp.]MDK2769332.1 lytic transglycosylase domain-containing protein [Sphingomonas sp.]